MTHLPALRGSAVESSPNQLVHKVGSTIICVLFHCVRTIRCPRQRKPKRRILKGIVSDGPIRKDVYDRVSKLHALHEDRTNLHVIERDIFVLVHQEPVYRFVFIAKRTMIRIGVVIVVYIFRWIFICLIVFAYHAQQIPMQPVRIDAKSLVDILLHFANLYMVCKCCASRKNE